MRILLARHAQAARNGPWSDVDRPLTDQGERDALRVARALARTEVRVARVVTSPARRCRDTGAIFGRAIGPEAIEVDDVLAMGARPADVVAQLGARLGEDDALVVAHAPDLSGIAAELLRARALVVFECASVACILVDALPPRCGGELEWHLGARLFGGLRDD